MKTYVVLLPAILVADALIVLWLVTSYGQTVEAALLFTRYSARVSFVVFLPAFVASSLHVLRPSTFTASLRRSRRQWGLSFAFAHTLHMIGIMVHYHMRGEWFSADDASALVIYALIYLMALTSNNWSVRKLGAAWKWLHKIGIYGIFVGYWVTYVTRLGGHQVELDTSQAAHEWYGMYLTLAILVNVAWLLRIIAFWKKRQASSSVPISG